MKNFVVLFVMLNVCFGVWAVAIPEDEGSSSTEAVSTSPSPSKSCENQTMIYESYITSLKDELASYARDREVLKIIIDAVLKLVSKEMEKYGS